MPKAIFQIGPGQTQTIDVPAGWSLMEGARQHDVPGIVGECGGGAICATCHVHVAEAWRSAAGEPSSAEASILDFVDNLDAGSRLSCQIEMSDALDGIEVTVATGL